MNLSATHGHRWYSPLASQFTVLLDGVKQLGVTTASADEGWVEYFEETSDTGVLRRSGVVEILMPPALGRFITPNFLRVAEWLTIAGKEVGNLEHLSVQVGCMLEEVAEFVSEIRLDSDNASVVALRIISQAASDLASLGLELKAGRAAVFFPDPVAALDALCDIKVTVNGVAFLAGWNMLQADLLVLEANDNKFVDGKPVILPGGKIGKRPGWEPADLTECIQNATQAQ